jgi:hypothetical protein
MEAKEGFALSEAFLQMTARARGRRGNLPPEAELQQSTRCRRRWQAPPEKSLSQFASI